MDGTTGNGNRIQGIRCKDTDVQSRPNGDAIRRMRETVGGNTAIQGSANTNTDSFDSILTRNIELYNFNKDFIHTKVTELESDYSGNHIKTGNSLVPWTHVPASR